MDNGVWGQLVSQQPPSPAISCKINRLPAATADATADA